MTGCREAVRWLEPWTERGIGASMATSPMTGEQKLLHSPPTGPTTSTQTSNASGLANGQLLVPCQELMWAKVG
jgi:hypothetical protein